MTKRSEQSLAFEALANDIASSLPKAVVSASVNDFATQSSGYCEADIHIYVDPRVGGKYSLTLKALLKKLVIKHGMGFVSLFTPRGDRLQDKKDDLASFYRRNPYKLSVAYVVRNRSSSTAKEQTMDKVAIAKELCRFASSLNEGKTKLAARDVTTAAEKTLDAINTLENLLATLGAELGAFINETTFTSESDKKALRFYQTYFDGVLNSMDSRDGMSNKAEGLIGDLNRINKAGLTRPRPGVV